jgi:hypothetical protein
MKKVHDRCAFTQKLRVGDYVKQMPLHTVALQGAADPLVGIDRNGALFNDDLITSQGASYFAGYGLNIREIGITGLALRSAYGNKYCVGFPGRLSQICRKTNPVVTVASKQLRKIVLMDEGVAALQGLDLSLIVIDAYDRVAHLCETDSGYQPDVSRTDDSNRNGFAHKCGEFFLNL